MPGTRRNRVDGTCYAAGYHAYTLKIELRDNPYRDPYNRDSWESGWLDARDEWAIKRDTEAQDLARAI